MAKKISVAEARKAYNSIWEVVITFDEFKEIATAIGVDWRDAFDGDDANEEVCRGIVALAYLSSRAINNAKKRAKEES